MLIASLLMAALLWLADRLWPLPMPGDDLARVVLAEDGTPLWRFADSDGVWRYPVSPEEVSPLYLEALLTYEDRWFYDHPGVNPLALARAAWLNLRGGRVVSGGSTLSMQVARLLDPHDRTLPGKLRQLWRTAQLEWHLSKRELSKREILQIYLDRAPFGGTLQGVAAASWAYLGKSPKHLTPAEAALLAVLPQAPSRLRPDRHPARAQQARDKVLQRLADYQVWPAQRIAEAREEPLLLAPRQEPALAPLLARPAAGLARASARAHLGGDTGGRGADHGGARLPRLHRPERRAALRSRRHGPRPALTRLHPQALPLWPGHGRRPDPFRIAVARRAATLRRLSTRQLFHGLQRAGVGQFGAGAVAQPVATPRWPVRAAVHGSACNRRTRCWNGRCCRPARPGSCGASSAVRRARIAIRMPN